MSPIQFSNALFNMVFVCPDTVFNALFNMMSVCPDTVFGHLQFVLTQFLNVLFNTIFVRPEVNLCCWNPVKIQDSSTTTLPRNHPGLPPPPPSSSSSSRNTDTPPTFPSVSTLSPKKKIDGNQNVCPGDIRSGKCGALSSGWA